MYCSIFINATVEKAPGSAGAIVEPATTLPETTSDVELVVEATERTSERSVSEIGFMQIGTAGCVSVTDSAPN